MKINSHAEMIALGKKIATSIVPPRTIELIGDVGAGKTTLTQGIAEGLGISEPITSPSFAINKKYEGAKGITLSHYDFYRLSDPGLMASELAESINDGRTVTVVEWAATVANILPNDTLKIEISYDDSSETARIVSIAPEISFP